MSSKAFTAQIFKWQAQVNADPALPASAMKVAVYLCSMFNEDEGGAAWPSCETISCAIGKSEATVINCVSDLKERGHLKVEWGKQGRGCSNKYWMILKPQEAKVSDPEKPQAAKVSKPRKPQKAKVSTEQKTSVLDSENLSFHPEKPQPAKETLSKDSSKDTSSSSARAREVIDCRTKIARAFEQAGKVSPDTAHVEVWAAQGYDLTLCATVVAEGVARKSDIGSLKYFDARLADVHAKRISTGNGHADRANDHAQLSAEPDETRWRRMFDHWLRLVRLGEGYWPSDWGGRPRDLSSEIPKSTLLPWLVETERDPDLAFYPRQWVRGAIARLEERLPPKDDAQEGAAP